MAYPNTWPASLPQYVLEEGYSERIQDQVIESQMESGPAKIRRRFTKSFRTLGVTMQMTTTQRATFETFWGTTLKGGSVPFTWVHPVTQASTDFRFRNPAPQYTVIGGTTVRVSFTLEAI